MSKIKVNELEPYSGSYFYVTGTVSSSAGFAAPNGTFSGSTGIYTVLTASQAFIDVLDVNQINSITTTETSLEVIDKLIIAASGSVDTTLSGSGLQIGGFDTTTHPLASMIYANHSLSLNVTGSETTVMYLSGSGYVGIGVTDPDAQLEVFDTGTQLKLSYDGTNYATFAVASDGQLDITTVDASAAAGHICFMPDGNVGIATTSPAAPAHVYKTATTSNERMEMLRLEVGDEGVDMNIGHGPGIDFYVGQTGGSNFGGTIAVVKEQAADADNDAAMVFHTATDDQVPANDREKMRITSAGNVGIGVTDPDTTLEVNGVAKATTSIRTPLIEYTDGDDAMTIADGGSVTFAAAITGSNGMAMTGSARFNDEVEIAGNVGIGTTSPTQALDVSGSVRVRDRIITSGSIELESNKKMQFGAPSTAIYGDGTTLFLSSSASQITGSVQFANDVTISDGSIDGVTIGASSSGAGTFSSFISTGVISGSAGMAITGSAKFADEVEIAGNVGIGTTSPSGKLEVVSGNDGNGTIAVRSGDASQYSKISMGTNANKATIAVPGGSGTFFTDTAAGDLVLRVDDNNGKIHIGAGTSGGAALIVTEHAGTDPRVGIGTASPIATLDVAGHIYPHTDNTYDIGSSSYRWRNIYTGDLHLRNERGDWTIVEEEDFLCVINNKTGKKYEMMLKPLDED